jgi:hypothetical protein
MNARGLIVWRSKAALFFAIVLIGCALRLGNGVARYQNSFSRTGADFVTLWQSDALEHVLIAKSLIEDGAYRVGHSSPELDGREVRWGEHDALFKAPLYQYFLAAVFAVSGFSFALFLPLQALIGGIASGFAALAALEMFHRWRIAAFSGLAAAGHPVLVNAAAQPYNENVFVALLFASLWGFARWLNDPRLRWAVTSGALGGLAVLCRETAAPLLVAVATYALIARPAGARRSFTAAFAVIAVAALVVAPWSLRNYVRTGRVIPVAVITGTALSIGNNECLAAEPLLTWYWAEGPCESLNAKRQLLIAPYPVDEWDNRVIRNSINAGLAAQFITERPMDYLKLSLKRAWTVLLPFHPWQSLGTINRIALSAYWLVILPAGVIGLVASLRKARGPAVLLGLCIGAVIVPQILVYFSPDMRYRIVADLLFAVFAGHVYAQVIRHALRGPAHRVVEPSSPSI